MDIQTEKWIETGARGIVGVAKALTDYLAKKESPAARRERIAVSLLSGLMANTNICDSQQEVVDECLDFTDMLVAILDAPKEIK